MENNEPLDQELPPGDLAAEPTEAPSIDDEMLEIVKGIEARERGEQPADEKSDRARDESGRFVKGEAQKPAQEATPAPQAADPKAPAQPAAFVDRGPPTTWRAGAKAAWDRVAPEIKAEIYKREQDASAGIQQYQSRAEVGNTLMSVISPYQPIMAALGASIPQALNEVLNTAAIFHVGTPQQKAETLRTLAQRHGIDVAATVNNGADAFRDPVIDELRKEIGQLKGELAGQRQASQNSEQHVARSEISAFQADPRNKYFANVQTRMGQLLKAGAAESLQHAYEIACLSDPEVRAAIAMEHEQSQNAERAKTAAAARRAGDLSVRSIPTPRPVQGTARSMDDTLAETYAAIQARDAA